MYSTIFALLFACGDAEETKEIPKPPAAVEKTVKPVSKTPEAKPAAKEGEETPTPSTEEVGKDGQPLTVGGTKPTVQNSEKLMTTKEVKAPQSKLLADKVEKQLRAKAKKEGYGTIKGFKLIKNECKAGGICTGIGQGTAVKTTITFVEGNSVSVKQEDGTAKDGIITKVEEGKFTVKYADDSEATVEKGSLGLKK